MNAKMLHYSIGLAMRVGLMVILLGLAVIASAHSDHADCSEQEPDCACCLVGQGDDKALQPIVSLSQFVSASFETPHESPSVFLSHGEYGHQARAPPAV